MYCDTKKRFYGRNREDENSSRFFLPKDVKNNAMLMHIESGVLYLNGEVNEEMAEYARESLMLLTSDPPKQGFLTVKISSPGGSVHSGLEIHDLLMLFAYETEIPVRGLAVGQACSAASTFLLQGCSYRIATENCTIMCHNALAVDYITERDLKSVGWHMKLLRELETIKQKMVTILMRRTKRTEREILKMLVRGRDMTAQEARDFGLVDDVMEFVLQEPKPVRNRIKKTIA